MSKYAIVTGAANGMGKAIAKKLVEEDFRVIAVDIDSDGLSELQENLGEDAVIKYEADIGKPEFATRLRERFSNVNINLLVNNAGIRFPKSILNETNDEWEKTIRVNLTAPFYLMREIGALMANSKEGGLVVNIASVAGIRGFNDRASYCASKGGLISLSKAAAIDLADKGVRVVSVCPGFTKTTMTLENAEDLAKDYVPIGKSGTAEDIAQVVCDLTKWNVTTGSTITVDGGLTSGFKW